MYGACRLFVVCRGREGRRGENGWKRRGNIFLPLLSSRFILTASFAPIKRYLEISMYISRAQEAGRGISASCLVSIILPLPGRRNIVILLLDLVPYVWRNRCYMYRYGTRTTSDRSRFFGPCNLATLRRGTWPALACMLDCSLAACENRKMPASPRTISFSGRHLLANWRRMAGRWD